MNHKKEDILKNIKGTGFGIPKNYFEDFENKFHQNRGRNTTGFKVPNEYFEKLEDTFIVRKNLNAMKGAGFKTPDSYFENVEKSVFLKRKKKKAIPLSRRISYKNAFLAIAASVLLFFSISEFNHNKNSISAIADTEIDSWIEEGLVSFNTYEIEEMFTDADLNLLAEESDEISDYLKYTDIEALLIEN
jgi:ribosomal protein S17E